MERCLRTANTPDIVRSTIKKKDVFDDTLIDREVRIQMFLCMHVCIHSVPRKKFSILNVSCILKIIKGTQISLRIIY